MLIFDGYRELITYDLVSRGSNEGDECFGTHNSSTGGWGPAYEKSCIHSGIIRASGDLPTTWYNYTLASAGVIISENTNAENPANNISEATESICPKGWTLPNNTQINSNRNVSNFSPVAGGGYADGVLYYEGTSGYWWGSEAYNGARRYGLSYSNNNQSISDYYLRYAGYYIRCVPAP